MDAGVPVPEAFLLFPAGFAFAGFAAAAFAGLAAGAFFAGFAAGALASFAGVATAAAFLAGDFSAAAFSVVFLAIVIRVYFVKIAIKQFVPMKIKNIHDSK
ncbi:MAG: hypothetical protein WCH05_04470 [Chlorobiaceae bacterium]